MSVPYWKLEVTDFGIKPVLDPDGKWVERDDHAAALEHERELRTAAFRDNRAKTATVRELTSEKDTIVSNAVAILTGGCLEHDEAVKAMAFDVFRKAVAGYTCPLCAKAHVRELDADNERLVRAFALSEQARDDAAEVFRVRVAELEAALTGMVALMERSDGVASIAHGPNGHEVGCIEWDWYEEVKALKAALAAVSARRDET